MRFSQKLKSVSVNVLQILSKIHRSLAITQRYESETHVRWVPCHHSMARPRVTYEGMASSYGGSCKYTE
jgi:hypothetical protein